MHMMTDRTALFHGFRQALAAGGIDGLRAGLIGKDAMVDGPFGPQKLIYADYVASGRALRQVETCVMDQVLPFYANTHTESSYTGARTTALRAASRQVIAQACGADDDYSVCFTGSGATAGLNRLVTLCGVPKARATGRSVRIMHGPYEHHSNILPWRESGAEVIEIPEADSGGPDMAALRHALQSAPKDALLIGTFSAASNVTGMTSDVAKVTRLLQDHGAMSIWDYAGGGPYLPINMRPAPGVQIDAISISPHKFVGGPGASGVMILRKSVCACDTPSWPGGGTVRFVSPSRVAYSDRIEDREEAGTPNILGDIRAGLAFVVKDVIGLDHMRAHHAALAKRGLDFFRKTDGLDLLGSADAARLPIFSTLVRDTAGQPVHYQYATRLLSDCHGVQARGGCACAGPYALRLLGIDAEAENTLFGRLQAGEEMARPGFVRINLSVLMTDAEVDHVLTALAAIRQDAVTHADRYQVDGATAMFTPCAAAAPRPGWRGLLSSLWPSRAAELPLAPVARGD